MSVELHEGTSSGSATWRVPLLLFAGMILMQAAWILTLPPFRGSDEFDHAYRAAAVAGGQWMPDYVQATNGRGDLLVVPRAIVKAAAPVCETYKYVGNDNCHSVEDLGGGEVTVASAAARYNPVFYWVIGTPAMASEGAHSLYAMRIVGAILCSLFVALAGWTITTWARTRWPLMGLVVAMTPVTVYSTAVAAPNGIEMAAALALWTALLGLTRTGIRPKIERLLLYAAIPSAVVLTGVRSMGPLWLALILLSATAILGVKHTFQLVRRQRVTFAIVTPIVATGVLASVWWTLTVGANSLTNLHPARLADPFVNSLKLLPLWFFQSIAAFPLRNDRAPTLVYASEAFLVVVLAGMAWWVANRRLRVALAGTFLVAAGVPFGLTLMTYMKLGGAWQGRYGLPYSFGLLLIASLALDRAGFRHRLQAPILMASWVALVIAHTIGATNVLLTERRESPLAGQPAWIMPQPWIVVLLMILGGLCWAAAVHTFSYHSPAPKEADASIDGGDSIAEQPRVAQVRVGREV